ncbi:MAG: hypothetical protein WBM12_15540, partial [Pseudolabrys sp.]
MKDILTQIVFWFGAVRGRTGLVVDDLLLYVTGGVAYAKFYNRPISPNATQVFQHSRTPWGFVVGAGTEWSFAPNWSLVSEFLYMGFERNSQSFACGSVATC